MVTGFLYSKFSDRHLIITLFIMVFGLCGCSGKTVQTQSPEPTVIEERGIWLNRTELYAPKEKLIRLLDDLKAANFTSVYIDTYFKGSVIYPDSKYLPLYAGAKEPDILKWLIPAIKKRGMRAEAWVEYGFYAFHVPDATKTKERGVFLDKYPELTAIAANGTPYLHNVKWGDFFSFCPSNPKSQKLLADLFVEILRRYPFDGLNLDRIRYPNKNFCFCGYCKGHFRKDTGTELKPYPKGTPGYDKFVKWRKAQLTRFMEMYSPRFRQARRGVTISLAALPPEMMDTHGQPWDLWLKKGYIDAAMPMLYGTARFESRVQTLKHFPHPEKIYYGLDAASLPPEKVIEQIRYLKKEGAKGFALWYSGKIEDDVPLLKAGPFSRPAVSPLDFPAKNL